jgi:hypothetical protein
MPYAPPHLFAGASSALAADPALDDAVDESARFQKRARLLSRSQRMR